MFRRPGLFIFGLVSASMVSAMLYTRWMAPGAMRSPQSESFAQVRERLQSDLQSSLDFSNNSKTTFDDPDKCDTKRKYLDPFIKAVPLIWRQARASNEAEFPRECTLFIQKTFMEAAETRPLSSFAQCSTNSSTPMVPQLKPCVTEEYVNIVYNSFVDLTSCLNLPQKDFLPRLLAESGSHLNVFGEGGDTGIAQLVGITISSARPYFQKTKNEILNSAKPACVRLKNIVSNLQAIPQSEEQTTYARCRLITPPENPLLSLMYMAIKYREDSSAIDYYTKQKGINELFVNAGMGPGSIDRDKYLKLMMALAYNAGAGGATDLMSEFLKDKVAHQKKVSVADFDFSQNLRDFNFKLKQLMEPFLIQSGPGAGRKIDPAKQADWDHVKEKNYLPYRMTFPEFLAVYQDVGAAGYLSVLYDYSRLLNKAFKEGTCVPDSYLSL